MQLHFDNWQFANRPCRVYSAATQLDYKDYELSMSVHTRKQVHERRLPVPIWALSDVWLRKLLVLFLESRVNVHNPNLDLLSRRAAAEKRIKNRIPGWNATIDKLQLEYVAAQHDGTPKERLRELETQIENLDTLVRMTQKGTLCSIAALVILYYRMGKNSVEVGEELNMKPPHVRQTLWGLHQLWNKTFNLDFMVEPAAPAVPACRSYTRQEIDGMLAIGEIQIPKDKPRLAPPPETEWDIQKRLAPHRVHKKIDAPRAARLKATGLSWKEVAAILGHENEQSVANAVAANGLLVPGKRGPKAKTTRSVEFGRPPRIAGESRKERRKRLVAAGICGCCEVHSCAPYSECPTCRAYYAEWERNSHKKKRAARAGAAPVQQVCALYPQSECQAC